MSLIEMVAATVIMATVMASVVVLVRSGYGVWNAYEQDIDINENAYGLLRHVVRQLRQAEAITAISGPSDTAGYLSFTTPSGTINTWTTSGNQVMFNNGSGDQLLAKSIDGLTFIGYDAAGNQTTTPEDIQKVRCIAQVTLTQGGGTSKTDSTTAWIRSW